MTKYTKVQRVLKKKVPKKRRLKLNQDENPISIKKNQKPVDRTYKTNRTLK